MNANSQIFEIQSVYTPFKWIFVKFPCIRPDYQSKYINM